MSGKRINPSGTDHVPRRQAPGENRRDQRELTEYRQPAAERDEPGARERERRTNPDPT